MSETEASDANGFIKKMAVRHLGLCQHPLTGGNETIIGEWPVLPDSLKFAWVAREEKRYSPGAIKLSGRIQ
jgi:hypothetical protein